MKQTLKFMVLGLVVLIFFVAASALAAGNTVPKTNIGVSTMTILLPTTFIPPECSGIVFDKQSEFYIGPFIGNVFEGGNGNDCIVGTAADETLNGGQGADVILGGAGNDTLNGGQGDDYLDGGVGTDTCIGGQGNGTETYKNCEIIG